MYEYPASKGIKIRLNPKISRLPTAELLIGKGPQMTRTEAIDKLHRLGVKRIIRLDGYGDPVDQADTIDLVRAANDPESWTR